MSQLSPAPRASVVIPVYNVAATLPATLASARAQTVEDIEILIVDDGGADGSVAIAEAHAAADPRIRILSQANRGLAGARNTGAAAARGAYVAFLDADDLWAPEKLARHIAHLEARPEVGVSFSSSALIDEAGAPIGLTQAPKLRDVTAADIFTRNPVGNGSAAVLRRAALDAVAYRPAGETERDWRFDETLRQSEDVEFWTRLAVTTDWRFEGLAEPLTFYRIASGGLSADTGRQLETWERMAAKLNALAPAALGPHLAAARAYQLRYLCRRAVASRDGARAAALAAAAWRASPRALLAEPVKTLSTTAAAITLRVGGASAYAALERLALAPRRAADAPGMFQQGEKRA
ncbi:MAG: glycosyltransferase family 2 protein [Pseudomonadota bacterium]